MSHYVGVKFATQTGVLRDQSGIMSPGRLFGEATVWTAEDIPPDALDSHMQLWRTAITRASSDIIGQWIVGGKMGFNDVAAVQGELQQAIADAFAAQAPGSATRLEITNLVIQFPNVPAAPPAPAPAPAGFAIGARVLVKWSDGNDYPGEVRAVETDKCLVHFPNGQEQWCPNEYVSPDPS